MYTQAVEEKGKKPRKESKAADDLDRELALGEDKSKSKD